MLLANLAWIAHTNDKRQKSPIYSLAVHPKGQKLATGGQDYKINLWNLAPALDEKLENDPNTPKLLATLAGHSGSVLCVRWSNGEGRYLASGSDDSKIVIWTQDNSTGPRKIAFGEAESSRLVESWKAVKVLAGHESDVADLGWSPENRYLASCGFETKVYIWDGQTFDRIRKLDSHTQFVKGLTWDPVGKYLATQSDDKTTKIWRVSDWVVEKEISEPYIAAASSTFFRRLSWSPDGNCIVTANGENGNIPVAPVIHRDGWTADVSLVGHSAPIECAQFSPVLYDVSDKASQSRSVTASAVCAVGSQDGTITIWWTTQPRPVAAGTSLFKHSVLDMSWSPDGLNLYGCSFDGTVALLSFEPDAFGSPLPAAEKERLLTTLGVKRKVVVESAEQLAYEEQDRVESKRLASARIADLMGTGTATDTSALASPSKPSVFPTAVQSPATPTPLQQRVTQTADGRKRIQPTFISSGLDAQITSSISNSAQDVQSTSVEMDLDEEDIPLNPSTANATSQVALISSSGNIPVGTGKRKRTDEGRDLNGVQPSAGATVRVEYVLPTVMEGGNLVNLAVPAVKDKVTVQVGMGKAGEALTVECNNNNMPGRIMCTRSREQIWADSVLSPALHVLGTANFIAVACVDGSLFIYSLAGRRLLPRIALEGPASFMACEGEYLMCLSSTGTITVWNVVRERVVILATSIVHLLRVKHVENGSSADAGRVDVTIKNATLRPEGIPVLTTSRNEMFTFHPGMNVWMQIADLNEPLVSSSMSTGSLDKGTIAQIRTLPQIENQLASHLTLRSSSDYRRWLKRYARGLADEGASSKVQELCDHLLGPPSRPSIASQSTEPTEDWEPMILGMPKRSLLADIIPILAKNRSLQRTVLQYKEILTAIDEREHLHRVRI